MIHTSETLRDAFHYLYPDELPELKRLVRLLPSDCFVVNVGSGAGTSSLAILESRPDVFLYAIDIQEADSPFGCLSAEKAVVTAAGLGHRLHQIVGDSKLVGVGWYSDPVDMVFVDGDHSYEGCKGDIEVWVGNIKPGGIIAIHDYRKGNLPENINGPHPKPWPGVDQAVDELLVGKYEQVGYVDSLISFRVK